jgi:hypothetical protein
MIMVVKVAGMLKVDRVGLRAKKGTKLKNRLKSGQPSVTSKMKMILMSMQLFLVHTIIPVRRVAGIIGAQIQRKVV